MNYVINQLAAGGKLFVMITKQGQKIYLEFTNGNMMMYDFHNNIISKGFPKTSYTNSFFRPGAKGAWV